MALACRCGWIGVNLVPNDADDTARCPLCNVVFQGIRAADARSDRGDDAESRTGFMRMRALGALHDAVAASWCSGYSCTGSHTTIACAGMGKKPTQ